MNNKKLKTDQEPVDLSLMFKVLGSKLADQLLGPNADKGEPRGRELTHLKLISEAGARALLIEDDEFRNLVGLPVIQSEIGEDWKIITPKLPIESAENAKTRLINLFFSRNPPAALFYFLEYVDLHVALGETIDRGQRKCWDFTAGCKLKPKAIELWESGGYEPDGCAIPIGQRELIDITDIRLIDEAELENSQKTVAVTFTWKLQPNVVGRAFDPQAPEFTALAQQLQVLLFDTGTATGMTKSYRQIQTGTVYFEDGALGWQIVGIEAEAG